MQGCEGVKEILGAREYGKKKKKGEVCVCVSIYLQVHCVERKKEQRLGKKSKRGGKGGKETDLGLSRGSEHEV